ncbi:2-C-methyl-D-erythritol 2,4-cyclodiphosphate synthase [Tepidibacillus marianensis]|uniref:2-C-methyl-D-erythritol 2,4-cyclodiphosphate synthase n=1 Tax=Tepidibacillus marianensis TaxID=3131995 RepID=UPI0030CEBEEE
MIRIGQGFDVHQFAKDRKLMIGGIEVPHEKGLWGHSDADVLLHALADAILGALSKGDIGKWFPDNDPSIKDIDSKVILERVWSEVEKEGYRLENTDLTIIAQKPKMAPYISQMRKQIANIIKCQVDQVNVKATTTEKLGFTGREEGIAALAIVLLTKNQ